MAERVVDGFQRILGVAVGFRLAEADVGHLALDDVDDAAVERLRRAGVAVVFGQRDRAIGTVNAEPSSLQRSYLPGMPTTPLPLRLVGAARCHSSSSFHMQAAI